MAGFVLYLFPFCLVFRQLSYLFPLIPLGFATVITSTFEDSFGFPFYIFVLVFHQFCTDKNGLYRNVKRMNKELIRVVAMLIFKDSQPVIDSSASWLRRQKTTHSLLRNTDCIHKQISVSTQETNV